MRPVSALTVCLLAVAISALTVAVYDVTVRQPRTPRLAVVDIARLVAAAELQAKSAAVARTEGAAPAPSLVEFGPRLEREMRDLASRCRCVVVAMATVVGDSDAIPDMTPVLAQRLQIPLAATNAGGLR